MASVKSGSVLYRVVVDEDMSNFDHDGLAERNEESRRWRDSDRTPEECIRRAKAESTKIHTHRPSATAIKNRVERLYFVSAKIQKSSITWEDD